MGKTRDLFKKIRDTKGILWDSLVAQTVKHLPAMWEAQVPESGRSPGEGNGNPLQYSCLENPMDGGAWWATVHGVAKSRTQLSDFTFTKGIFHAKMGTINDRNGMDLTEAEDIKKS